MSADSADYVPKRDGSDHRKSVGRPIRSSSPPVIEGKDLNEKVTSLIAANRQLKRKIFDLYTIFEISRHFNSVLDSMWLIAIRKSLIFIKGRVLRTKPDGYQNVWNGF